jgi:hypothetical protein
MPQGQQPGQPAQPGMPPGAPQMPQMVPNPAYAQWQQAQQASQAIQAQNQQKQQQFDAAVALIKKDGVTGFKLDIESDSTIAPDEMAEQASRVTFLQQMVPLLEQVVPIAQGNPPLAALAKEITLFAVRGFRVGRTLEETFEAAFDAIGKMPPPAPKGAAAAPHQDPAIAQAKIAADVHDTQTKAQTDQLAIAQKQQQAQLQAQSAAQRDAAETQHSQDQLMLQAAELQQRERLETARLTSMAARQGRGLV